MVFFVSNTLSITWRKHAGQDFSSLAAHGFLDQYIVKPFDEPVSKVTNNFKKRNGVYGSSHFK